MKHPLLFAAIVVALTFPALLTRASDRDSVGVVVKNHTRDVVSVYLEDGSGRNMGSETLASGRSWTPQACCFAPHMTYLFRLSVHGGATDGKTEWATLMPGAKTQFTVAQLCSNDSRTEVTIDIDHPERVYVTQLCVKLPQLFYPPSPIRT
jgi:hypothetical protein